MSYFNSLVILLAYHSEGLQLTDLALLHVRLHSRAGLHRRVTTASLGF